MLGQAQVQPKQIAGWVLAPIENVKLITNPSDISGSSRFHGFQWLATSFWATKKDIFSSKTIQHLGNSQRQPPVVRRQHTKVKGARQERPKG